MASASHSASSKAGPSSSAAHASPTVNPDRIVARARTVLYPKEIWWFLAAALFLVGAFQLVTYISGRVATARRLRKRIASTTPTNEKSGTDAEKGAGDRLGRTTTTSWRHIPLAAINLYRTVAFRWTVNLGASYTLNLAEVFITCAYIAALFTWALINTTSKAGVKFTGTYWANRAGAIVASQTPLVTVLGTKNNAISWLTGVGYEKLNYLHRVSARTIMVLTWVHAGGRIVMDIDADDMATAWLRCGILALSALTLLCIISVRPARNAAYETFFYMHFVCVLLWLIGAYFHTRRFHWDTWVWPSFVIWSFDRLVRAFRTILANTTFLAPAPSHTPDAYAKEAGFSMSATPELVGGIVRLRVVRPAHFFWKPAQTAFLILPGVSMLPIEAHPFTIASVDESEYAAGAREGELAEGNAAAYWKEMVFLINVREGFTKRLAQAAREGRKVRVLVDGPYGSSPDLAGFETIVLIAGGTGVSHTLATLLDTVYRARDGTTLCNRIVFVWAVRDASHIDWIADALGRALTVAPSSLTIDIRIHITAGASNLVTEPQSTAGHPAPALGLETQPDLVYDDAAIAEVSEGETPSSQSIKTLDCRSEEIAEKTSKAVLALAGVQTRFGRPDLSAILREEVEGATGRMAVTVCGSQAVARATRAALCFGPSMVMKGGPSVTLHVESYGYA